MLRRRDTAAAAESQPAHACSWRRTLRSAHPDDMEFVHAVLAMFTQQPFYYTLTPPKLSDDSVDEFLFDTKRGFCGHYASAFAVLMRAAGIPARVVTGYQGGTFNRFADYWIVRQSDAHAWDEVWIEGRGWVRIDPTAAIAPSRVERGLDGRGDRRRIRGKPLATQHSAGSPTRGCVSTRCGRYGANASWSSTRTRSASCSQWLHIPEPDGQKLVLVLAAAMALGAVLADLAGAPRTRSALARTADPRLRAAVRQIGGGGDCARMPHEGRRRLCGCASRSCAPGSWPAASTALCRHYSICAALCQLQPSPRPVKPRCSAFRAAARARHSGRVHAWPWTPGMLEPRQRAAARAQAARFSRVLRNFDLRPALLGQSEIDAGRREIHQLAGMIDGQIVVGFFAKLRAAASRR